MQLRDHAEDLRAGGATLAAIGCGSAAQAGALRAGLRLPFAVYADPGRHSFEAAGLRRDLEGVNPLRRAGSALRAMWKGVWPAGIQGDPLQLGGTFVFAAGGEVLYAYRSRAADDHAPIDALIAALA